MSNDNPKKYDLKERTFLLSKNLVSALKKIKGTAINQNSILQCVRSGTSTGANYHEADCAESRKDFEHKIGICKKEAQETQYWLKLLLETEENTPDLEKLCGEAEELTKIFVAISLKSKANSLDIRN